MDFSKIVFGMFILIGVYLFGRFGNLFDGLFQSTSDFVLHQTSVLQGNYPFAVYPTNVPSPQGRLNLYGSSVGVAPLTPLQ